MSSRRRGQRPQGIINQIAAFIASTIIIFGVGVPVIMLLFVACMPSLAAHHQPSTPSPTAPTPKHAIR